MLSHLPRTTPSWSTLLADLGNPHPAPLARALDVSPRTLERWAARGDAPRSACLALFFVSRWGASHLESGTVRRLVLAESLVLALRVDLLAERRRVSYLEGLAHTGAANGPVFAQR